MTLVREIDIGYVGLSWVSVAVLLLVNDRKLQSDEHFRLISNVRYLDWKNG